MQILVDNQIQDLVIVDPATNSEWTQDLIGNADSFDGFDDEQQLYVMTADNYTWWSEYIDVEQNLQYRMHTIKTGLNNDAREIFHQSVRDAGSSDYEQMQSNITDLVEQYEYKRNPRGAGRPPIDPRLKKNPVNMKLPQWLIEWTAAQPDSRAILIENALIEKHGLVLPTAE